MTVASNRRRASSANPHLFESLGGEGGILTPSYRLSQHVLSNMRENRLNTGDFYGLAVCNSFNRSA